jgi:hypothetical protein
VRQPLSLAGAIAAAIVSLLVPLHIAAFVIWPPPLEGTAVDWFLVFERSAWLGLVSMDLALMLDYVLLVPIYLGLYVLLRDEHPDAMLLGTALGLVAVAIYFPSNPAIEMWRLSDRHALASEPDRNVLVAAGEATIARYQGTAFHVSYILGSLAGVLVSWPMLRSPAFGRVAGWAGVIGNVVGFGLYLPVVGLALSVLSGPILWVWFLLVARGFLRYQSGRITS